MRRRRGRPLVIVLQPPTMGQLARRRGARHLAEGAHDEGAHDITRRAMFAAGTARTHEPRAHRNGAVAVKPQRFVAKRTGAL